MTAIGSRDIVFFLGAGFSAEAGYRVMAEFGKRAAEELCHFSTDPDDDPEKKPTVSLLREAFKKHSEFQKFLKQNNKLISFNVDNIEDVFCLAEMFRQSKINKIPLSSGDCDVDLLIREIQICIWKVYQEYPPKNHRLNIDTSAYDGFIDLLKRPELNKRVSFITTNYDLLLETLAWERKFKISYFFNEALAPLNLSKNEAKYIDQTGDADHAPLIKLHGSINLFKNSNNTYGISNDVALKGERIGGSFIPTDRPAIFALDALSCILDRYGNSITPALIPPTYSKLDQIDWLQTSWSHGVRLLSQAKVVIFIGYSMPVSDAFIKSMFNAAMAVGKKSDKPNIYLIKRLLHEMKSEDPVFNRFKDFFSMGFDENFFIPKKFTDASSSGAIEKILYESLL